MTRSSAGFVLPISLDVESATPMYRQLSDWFRCAIAEGKLRPGQSVPSSRTLARELKVSRIPVLSAYEQLCAEGYLETFVGAGTRVAQAIPDDALKPSAAMRRRSAQPAMVDAPRRVAQRATALCQPAPTWLANQGAFRVGLPALDRFPAATWSKLVNRHARKPPLEAMVYGGPMGYLPFREAIAEYLGAVRAVRCDASQILVTTGSQQGLQLAAQVLLDVGEQAWVEDPGYPGARQALTAVGALQVPVPVDQEGLDVAEGIRRAPDARIAYITPSHQFPLGVTMSAARRMQLLSWAMRSGAWIIEDDYDSEFRFGGRPLASLQGLDTDHRVIYVGTLSKVMFPSLRIGYVVVPKDLLPLFAAVRDASDTFSSNLYQRVMADFIREGHFARHIRGMRMLYMERRKALQEAIDQYARETLEVIGAEAGMQVTALLPPGIDDIAVSVQAAALGVSARPLSICYHSPPVRGGLILGYGGASVADIREGIKKLATLPLRPTAQNR
ncbi:transcriptional regulator, GntR family [Dyella sp. OK004]|uniref:MocR-like pyridoxine biosynthesis transcription factor PdxR n=1 Tax=Dyella sp. OK004 TaxID=1855292 RepID=UPI0008EDC509|nr:PLP-dependent aminotransferase family protein [Dyella sp. OK004]SFS20123.1 transcriptional regulator, GntR family [Dyella sp. OK004]